MPSIEEQLSGPTSKFYTHTLMKSLSVVEMRVPSLHPLRSSYVHIFTGVNPVDVAREYSVVSLEEIYSEIFAQKSGLSFIGYFDGNFSLLTKRNTLFLGTRVKELAVNHRHHFIPEKLDAQVPNDGVDC
jgi:lysine/ornithine N-monooxygenase